MGVAPQILFEQKKKHWFDRAPKRMLLELHHGVVSGVELVEQSQTDP